RSGLSNVAAHPDQRRSIRLERGCRKRVFQCTDIVDIGHVEHVPTVGLESLALVLMIPGQRGGTIDRDSVIVEEDRELAEPESARERRSLLRYAFHQIPVRCDDVDAMVD